MTQRIVGAVIVALLLGAVTQRTAADEKSQKALEGTYKVEKAVRGGQEMPAEKRQEVAFEFKGNQIIITEPNRSEEAQYTIDSSKTPSTITIKPKNKDDSVKGIYKLEGDTLTLCVSDEEAPTKFESPEGSKNMLLVLKRAKK